MAPCAPAPWVAGHRPARRDAADRGAAGDRAVDPSPDRHAPGAVRRLAGRDDPGRLRRGSAPARRPDRRRPRGLRSGRRSACLERGLRADACPALRLGRDADRPRRGCLPCRAALPVRRRGRAGRGTPARGPGDVVAVRRQPRAGWVALAAGLLALAAAARLSPTWHPPLFDGVVVEDPYKYLQPPPGKPGNPSSVSDTLALDQGVSPQPYPGT